MYNSYVLEINEKSYIDHIIISLFSIYIYNNKTKTILERTIFVVLILIVFLVGL